MSLWSTRRQLFFILLGLAVVAVLAVLIFFIFFDAQPTCNDGKQNQDEIGIDCGGVCQKVCPAETSEIITLWNRVFKVREGQYDVAAFLENPNPFGVRALAYEFKIYDEDNILIRELAGVTPVNPEERFLITVANIDVGKRIPARAFIEVASDPTWLRLNSVNRPKLTVSDRELTFSPAPRLRATLTNESFVAVDAITVSAIVFDKDKNALGVSSTFVDGLKAGESKDIFFTWAENFAREASVVEIIPRTNLLLDNS